MIATYIPVKPPGNATAPGMEPEKLAAILARYSRSNDGIGFLLEKFKDSSPDAIFQFVDYGHASIAGLTGGVAIALDEVSMLLAAKFFEFAQMADGQESSTRYITLSINAMPSAAEVGLPEGVADRWEALNRKGFELYNYTVARFNHIADTQPDKLNLPEKAYSNEKLKTRLVKNYGLDRARYFLPLACKTNLAIVATARVWADIIRLIESLQWKEAVEAARLARIELEKASPNLVRHSFADEASIAFVQEMLAAGNEVATQEDWQPTSARCKCNVEVFTPSNGEHFNRFNDSLGNALATRKNRYSHTGVAIKRQIVTAQWSHMAIAEMRDLNRHRTGFRFSDWGPRGFFIPDETKRILAANEEMEQLKNEFLEEYHKLVCDIAENCQTGLQAYCYFLGTQIPFEHTQHADKFLYEVELRTGMGAHFKYAEHLVDAADLYFEQCPETREFITIGNAEPE